jgi:Spy/CpxP family protein refolding chaperone
MQRGRTASVAGRSYSAVARRLDLTAEQREQLSAILADGQNADASWRAANPNATRDERQQYAEERREATKAAIRSILTESQAARFDELGSRSMERTRPTRLRRGSRR